MVDTKIQDNLMTNLSTLIINNVEDLFNFPYFYQGKYINIWRK